ncbi:hypothetical protein [Thalassobacillus pellis]|uniref:hypothetical protein n=1 Tax=Thalassobacillus pellis TaxID=748008 RepID=UPI0019620B84|nr:hypothetical protein [Thalassobacillus pellis]MBM7554583.1 hypothetical protein [Thalassobacillus pellis]
MKKISLLLTALTLAMVIPITSAHAADPTLNRGNGEWDWQGTFDLFYNDTYDYFQTVNCQSTGGSFMMEARAFDKTVMVQLWEDDPSGDDYVGQAKLGHGDSVYFNIENLVDGSNNRAELFALTYENPWKGGELPAMYFWD